MPASLLKQASKRQYGDGTDAQGGGGVWAECKARSQKPLLSVDAGQTMRWGKWTQSAD